MIADRLKIVLMRNVSALVACLLFCAAALGQSGRIPVILDTDIGDDIDDTFALAMVLKHSRFDVKLITTTHGSAEYRAKLVCKLLEVAGRTDIPVGLGAGGKAGGEKQLEYVADYQLADYPGKVYEDGVQALIDVVKQSDEPVCILAIGPLETVAEALTREPALAGKSMFVGMHGSVRISYNRQPPAGCEWNVWSAIKPAQTALHAKWRETRITPLDTCGVVRLDGENFGRLLASEDKLMHAVLENYRIHQKAGSVNDLKSSTTLFDCVAVYLADPAVTPLYEIEELPIVVTDGGMTVIDASGQKMQVATKWRDLKAFRDLLSRALVGEDWIGISP